MENVLISIFSGHKGDPNDVETFLNISLFVVEYSEKIDIFKIFFNQDINHKVEMSPRHGSPLCREK